ncbi:putative transcription factor C2H2 family [Dioscorea sansibarensis]
MFPSSSMSYPSSISDEATGTVSSNPNTLSHLFSPISPPPLHHQHQTKPKKKRSQPGNPDPEAEVVALSPKSLMATNRFVCEICNKGFQRDQNLQLHRRGHNLPWKLRQRSNKEVVKKRVYVCPEASCVHHHPSRALGDLTGIKKHYSRKHGEKKWKCDKCSKRYAVHSDWKAHIKNCGTKEYKCDCGILFSRKDSFITHRAFCDALAQESARVIAAAAATATSTSTSTTVIPHPPPPPLYLPFSSWNPNLNPSSSLLFHGKPNQDQLLSMSPQHNAVVSTTDGHNESRLRVDVGDLSMWQKSDRLTRDFLGVDDDGTMGMDLATRGEHTAPFGIPTWSDYHSI